MKSGDVEAQTNGRLYPNQMETPQLRWAFIRKVYSIISFQLALTIAVAAAVVFIPGIPQFFLRTTPGVISFISIFVFTLLSRSHFLFLVSNGACVLFFRFSISWFVGAVSIALWFMHRKHPWNYILLILFTIAEAILVGLCCAFKQGNQNFWLSNLITRQIVDGSYVACEWKITYRELSYLIFFVWERDVTLFD